MVDSLWLTLGFPIEVDKKSLQSPGPKRPELSVDQRDSIVFSPKNAAVLKDEFNIDLRVPGIFSS